MDAEHDTPHVNYAGALSEVRLDREMFELGVLYVQFVQYIL